ncbi:cobalamin-dependent protein [Candidatus Pelagibacter ubique]|nr:cobalamin-dependent protein [Candidatus Pelagibacter ubique]
MRVLLISPNWKWCEEEKNVNYPFPPYNLCLLAAIVRDAKLVDDIKIVDAYVDDLEIADVKKIIKEYKPDVMGTTVLMDQLCDAGHIVTRITKEVNSNTITIMGGVYVTMNSKRAIEDVNLDYACVGEGETVFPAMLRYFRGEEKELPSKGIMYKKKW